MHVSFLIKQRDKIKLARACTARSLEVIALRACTKGQLLLNFSIFTNMQALFWRLPITEHEV